VTVSASGVVDVPQTPGLGFTVDLDYLNAHTENIERIKVKTSTA